MGYVHRPPERIPSQAKNRSKIRPTDQGNFLTGVGHSLVVAALSMTNTFFYFVDVEKTGKECYNLAVIFPFR